MTQAYHLINEVIMHPQIMWTRNFFYSLGAMVQAQQQIMFEWFTEMNEVSSFFVYNSDILFCRNNSSTYVRSSEPTTS